MKKNKILVVVAHPDDEVLGCGGTIARFAKQGYEVNILVISDGESSRNLKDYDLKRKIKNRKKACFNVAKLLRAKKPNFCGYPDNQLDKIPLLKITKEIEKFIKKIKPNLIFTHHWGDLNIDHVKVNAAVVTACRPQKGNTVKTLLFFEIPSSTEWQISSKKNTFSPNWFVDITKQLKKKIKALNIYKSEIKKWPHPRSTKAVISLAKWRGATVGYKSAAAFVLGRHYE